MDITDQIEIFDDVSNPLDSIEDMLTGHDWVFDRLNPDELSVQVGGRHGQYRMTFIWQEEYSAMQFYCEFDLHIPKPRREMAHRALHTINGRLWLGHFIVAEETGVPCFRHTSLFRGWTQTSGAEHIEDLVDIALAECERHHGIFNLLSCSLTLNDSLLRLALSESEGEA